MSKSCASCAFVRVSATEHPCVDCRDYNNAQEPRFELNTLVLIKKGRKGWESVNGKSSEVEDKTHVNKRAIIIEASSGKGPFGLYIESHGSVWWFSVDQLQFIDNNQGELLSAWREKAAIEKKNQSDLDWIFSRKIEDINLLSTDSFQALSDCLGTGNIWGSRGEGIDLYYNCMTIKALAEPFIKIKNKDAWLAFCENFKRLNKERSFDAKNRANS